MSIGPKLKNVKFMLVRNLIFFDFSDTQNLNDLWVTEKKRKCKGVQNVYIYLVTEPVSGRLLSKY